MHYKCLIFQQEDGVAVIKMNRPDVLNSFNRLMAEELLSALQQVQKSPEVRCALLTGEGRAFCAGQDLEEVDPALHPGIDLGKIVQGSYIPIIQALRSLEKPVVCVVNGVAAGAGANLALACDVVLASDKASFIQSFCNIGLVPDSGGSYFLPRLIGLNRAKALCLLGDKVAAADALQMGMIYKVHAADQAYNEGLQLAKHLATQPTKGLGLIKRALNDSGGHTLQQQLELEADLQRQAGKTKDYAEGILAFREKRKPHFQGC